MVKPVSGVKEQITHLMNVGTTMRFVISVRNEDTLNVHVCQTQMPNSGLITLKRRKTSTYMRKLMLSVTLLHLMRNAYF